MFLTFAQYFSNYRLIARWYEDNPRVTNHRPRAISVGMPASVSTVVDRDGLGEGVAVPEADRDLNARPIYHEKKLAIPAIPLIDEEGNEIVQSEEDSKIDSERFKQGVYDNEIDLEEHLGYVNSASQILNKTDPVEMRGSRKMRRNSSKKKKKVFAQAPFEGTLLEQARRKNPKIEIAAANDGKNDDLRDLEPVDEKKNREKRQLESLGDDEEDSLARVDNDVVIMSGNRDELIVAANTMQSPPLAMSSKLVTSAKEEEKSKLSLTKSQQLKLVNKKARVPNNAIQVE